MGIVQPTQIVSHTEDILDESADFALLLAAAAYNQVVHELRIPIGETYLPVSAMTYSLYRRVFSHLQNPANQAIEAEWRDKLTYHQIIQHVQDDHKQWNLRGNLFLRVQRSASMRCFSLPTWWYSRRQP